MPPLRARQPADSRFCAQCGATESQDESMPWHAFFARPADKAPSDAVYLSLGRMLGLTAVTFGLYQVYWLYVTWKQLASETEDAHYPLWHTLAILFVPIYGLFRLHKHVAVITKLARAQGVDTTLSPLLAVFMWFLSSVLQALTLQLEDPGTALGVSSVRAGPSGRLPGMGANAPQRLLGAGARPTQRSAAGGVRDHTSGAGRLLLAEPAAAEPSWAHPLVGASGGSASIGLGGIA